VFVRREGLPAGIMTAMYDLEAIGLVEFINVDHSNKLTADGRDVVAAGMNSLWSDIAENLCERPRVPRATS